MRWLCLLLGHVWAFLPERYQYFPYRTSRRRWRWARVEVGRDRCVCCGRLKA